jgi:hypothetical protein
MRTRVALALLFVFVAAARLCHVGIVWVEEAYPGAAALQILYGKALYRDIWFDKPPLSPLLYLLWGAHIGWPLRIAGAAFVFACALAAFAFARDLWSEREGLAAAFALAFFLTFGIPAAVMALAPDLVMLLPHIIAVWLAYRQRPFWGGVIAGIAFLANPKGVFVLAACALWRVNAWPRLAAGFVLPNAIAIVWLAGLGALGDYWRQVWVWGRLYSAETFVSNPLREGVLRTLNWAGFQAALVAGALVFWLRGRHEPRIRIAAWAAIALVSVTMGLRFFPRYYFALLPPLVMAAARGFVLMRRTRAVLALLLLIPLIRFGPRYIVLAGDLIKERETPWSDIAINRDSERASSIVIEQARPGDTLLVWGYRPDIFAYTRLRAGSRFLDSQPLTGVIADRHLWSTDAAAPQWAARNREALTHTRPSFIVDGLGPINPALAIDRYADLQRWLACYDEIGRTAEARILARRTAPDCVKISLD